MIVAPMKDEIRETLSLCWNSAYIDTGNESLKKQQKCCHVNARYFSKTIPNQISTLIGEYIRETLVQDIKEAKLSPLFAMKLLTMQILNSCLI